MSGIVVWRSYATIIADLVKAAAALNYTAYDKVGKFGKVSITVNYSTIYLALKERKIEAQLKFLTTIFFPRLYGIMCIALVFINVYRKFQLCFFLLSFRKRY